MFSKDHCDVDRRGDCTRVDITAQPLSPETWNELFPESGEVAISASDHSLGLGLGGGDNSTGVGVILPLTGDCAHGDPLVSDGFLCAKASRSGEVIEASRNLFSLSCSE